MKVIYKNVIFRCIKLVLIVYNTVHKSNGCQDFVLFMLFDYIFSEIITYNCLVALFVCSSFRT
jgi:hypothetical protein